jgi:hypothetical protein
MRIVAREFQTRQTANAADPGFRVLVGRSWNVFATLENQAGRNPFTADHPSPKIPRANLRWRALPLKITADGLARPY